ncbi:MAG: hypothetical protein Q4G02_01385 [bacterium]|nr:hypothetical protein [bacterium]
MNEVSATEKIVTPITSDESVFATTEKQKSPFKLIVGIIIAIIILAGVILLIQFMRQRAMDNTSSNLEATTPSTIETTAEETIKANNLKQAKFILNFLWTQRNEFGLYAIASDCKERNDLTSCAPTDDTWRWSLPVMWARFKYYEATADQEELSRLQTDLDNMVTNVLNSDARFLQVGAYNCAFMQELANSKLLNDDIKAKATQICFQANSEGDSYNGIAGAEIAQAALESFLTNKEIVFAASPGGETFNIDLNGFLYGNLDQTQKLAFSNLNEYDTATKVINYNYARLHEILEEYVNKSEQFTPIQQCLWQENLLQYSILHPELQINLPDQFQKSLSEFDLNFDDFLSCAIAFNLNQHLGKAQLQEDIAAADWQNGVIFVGPTQPMILTNTNALAAGFLSL